MFPVRHARIYVGSRKRLTEHPPATVAGCKRGGDGITGFFIGIAELCNGSTYDSDSYCLGSNPSSAATRLLGQAVKTSPSQGGVRGSIPLGATKGPAVCRALIFVKQVDSSREKQTEGGHSHGNYVYFRERIE
jgi:hypothetical protein